MGVILKLETDKTKKEVIEEISKQLAEIENQELIKRINSFQIDPTLHLAIWDYDKDLDKYPVWLVFASEKHDTGILFSEYGFDFGNWGLTTLSSEPFHFGPDYNWHSNLKDAFLESWMSE